MKLPEHIYECVEVRERGSGFEEFRLKATFSLDEAINWANNPDIPRDYASYHFRQEVRDWTRFEYPEEYRDGMSAAEALDAMSPDSMYGWNPVEAE